tara:strand:+ start:23 stop:334 length:312 start_codon:yes stop_codon:yes gene_type:complete
MKGRWPIMFDYQVGDPGETIASDWQSDQRPKAAFCYSKQSQSNGKAGADIVQPSRHGTRVLLKVKRPEIPKSSVMLHLVTSSPASKLCLKEAGDKPVSTNHMQ